MTIDLKKITKGRVTLPPRVVWYSFDGVGKTTAASGAPEPFFLDLNMGSAKHDVARVRPQDFDEFVEWLYAIERGQVPCKSVVIDSLTELESMLNKKFFGDKGPNSGDWAYGRGDDFASSKWREVLAQLERIWLQGKVIIMTAHAKVKKFNDPTGLSFDRFELSLRPDSASQVRQWADFVLFAREEVLLAQENKQEKNKGKTTGVRFQYTRRSPAFDAKARGSAFFPPVLHLGWQPLWEAIQQDEARLRGMRDEIDVMLKEIADTELTTKVVEWLRQQPGNVVETHNRVKELLDQKRAAIQEGEAAAVEESSPAAA